MTIPTLLEVTSGLLILGLAAWTVAARQALSAVAVFAVYGLLLAIVWVQLAAADVALTEAAIGGGVTCMLLLGCVSRLRGTDLAAQPVRVPLRIGAGVLCATVALALGAVVLTLPDPAPTLVPLVLEKLSDSGLGNPVAGVLFVYRSLDTLLEKVVLLLALLAIWSLPPGRFWRGVPDLRGYPETNPILTLFAQILPPVGIMFAVYLTWAGADQPGGAFQGGAVLAAMWLLVMIARQRDVPLIDRAEVRLLLVAGPLVFFAIGLAGSGLAGAFLAYPSGYAKPLIVVIEFALAISIAVTLGLLAAGPPRRSVPE